MNEMQRSGRKIYSGTEQAKLLIQEGFTRFTKEKISCYEGYLRRMNGPTGSYMRVANILCWGFYSIPYIREVNGFALIVNDDAYYGHFSVLMPVGDYEDTEGLKACLLYGQELMDKLATECVFLQAKDWMRPYLDRIQGLEYSLEYNEAESDYIYPLLKMQESMERRHVHYGEKIRHFTTEHDPEINCYQKEDFEACLAIIQKQHCDQDGCSGCVFGCIREWFSILTESLNELHAQIYVVRSYNKRDVHGSGNESGHGSCNERVHGSGNETGNCNENGKVLAFITMIRDEDLLYFDRKASHDLPGLTEYLNRFIVDTWGTEYEFMNFEEDMGSAGLRRHKKALGPHFLSHNYSLCIKETDFELHEGGAHEEK